MYTYIHTYIHTYIDTYVYMYTYIHTYIHTYICIHVYMYTYMHACIIHSFVRSFIHSLIHSCMLGWMDGWMDGCTERERERTCNRHVKFLRMFCFAFDNTLGARYFKDVSHQLHVNVFSYECLGCSFLNHVQRIYTYPNLSRVTTFRHLVGTLVATCHLSGDMFCPD